MDNVLQLEKFDIFIVEVTLGVDFEGRDSEVKLLTQSREDAFEKANKLSQTMKIGNHDYGFLVVYGGFFDSSVQPIILFQSNMVHAEHGRWCNEDYIDLAAGGIDIIEDAESSSNKAAFNILRIEHSLSQSKRIIGRFASMKAR
jgi:hypothetical protein